MGKLRTHIKSELMSDKEAFEKREKPIGMLTVSELIDETAEKGDKLAQELQQQLVQTCIDFINEHENINIDRVSFTADSLQESAKYESWQPCTDSSITLEGLAWDENTHYPKYVDIGHWI